jgi:hypothetical protein
MWFFNEWYIHDGQRRCEIVGPAQPCIHYKVPDILAIDREGNRRVKAAPEGVQYVISNLIIFFAGKHKGAHVNSSKEGEGMPQ